MTAHSRIEQFVLAEAEHDRDRDGIGAFRGMVNALILEVIAVLVVMVVVNLVAMFGGQS